MNHQTMRLQNPPLKQVKYCISPQRGTQRRPGGDKTTRRLCFAEPSRRGLRRSGANQSGQLSAVVQALESEAVRRALSGVSIPVFHQGRECGSTVKHSDQLLMFLLKTLHPARYGGGKEAAAKQEDTGRTFALEIDLSAADAAPGQEHYGEGGDEELGEGAVAVGPLEEGILY
jgi:hypothetical protein